MLNYENVYRFQLADLSSSNPSSNRTHGHAHTNNTQSLLTSSAATVTRAWQLTHTDCTVSSARPRIARLPPTPGCQWNALRALTFAVIRAFENHFFITS